MKMNKTLNAVKRRFASAQGAVSDVAVKAAKGGKAAAAETPTPEPAAGAADGGDNALV